MIKSGIYQILNLINQHCYIGQAYNLRGRKNKHFRDLRKGKHDNPHLQSAFRKYGEKTFKFIVLDYIEDLEALTFWEQVWMILFHPEYNINPIACRPPDQTGKHHTKETCIQISKSMKRFWTPERRQKHSEALMGHRRLASKEVRYRIGKTRRGKTWEEIYSPEYVAEMRQKRSELLKGKTYDEIYGPERAAKIKQKLSKASSGRNKGKTYDEIYGPERATEIRQKLSEARKRYWIRWRAQRKGENQQ